MYVPTLARFTARDPIAANAPMVLYSRLPYGYAQNSPVGLVDPAGLQPLPLGPEDPPPPPLPGDANADGLAVSHWQFKGDETMCGYFVFCRPVVPTEFRPIEIGVDILQLILKEVQQRWPSHCMIAMRCCCDGETTHVTYWSSFADGRGEYTVNIAGREIKIPYVHTVIRRNDQRDMERGGLGMKVAECDPAGQFTLARLLGRCDIEQRMIDAMTFANAPGGFDRIPYLLFLLNSNDTLSYLWYRATGQTLPDPPVSAPGYNLLVTLDKLGLLPN